MSYVLRDHDQGYFRGLLNGEDVVWTQERSRALRFRSREMAELAMVGHAPNAEVVKLRRRMAKAPPTDDKAPNERSENGESK